MTRLLLFLLAIIGIEFYAFQVFKALFNEKSYKTWIYSSYWGLTGLTFALGISYLIFRPAFVTDTLRQFFSTWVFMFYLAKLFLIPFLVFDDISRLIQWVWQKITASPYAANGISRSDFLMKLALGFSAVPFTGLLYGIISGAHDYRIHRHKIALKNLPNSFEGLKIVQISDIHSGSFFNKTAVERGIQMILDEKPDVIFFTGDLVNNFAHELEKYVEVFKKLEAKMGVFSILGNHDYGDYALGFEPSEEKVKNLAYLKKLQADMGWRLLLNEHTTLEKDGEKIALIGVEYISAMRSVLGGGDNKDKQAPASSFVRQNRGDLAKAYAGAENYPVKLLLSHDPTHWDAEVRTQYPDIDMMFAGHTHGFQFGIESKFLRWSPVEYAYKQWAGLYQEGEQYLYVNRGFGYIGYPGRIGIFPEITVFELTKKA